MKKKVVRLTEEDLVRIVKKVVSEQKEIGSKIPTIPFPVAPKWLDNVLEMNDNKYRMSLIHKSIEGLHELLKKIGCNDYNSCIKDIREYRHKFKRALSTVTTVDEPGKVKTSEEKQLERLDELERLLKRAETDSRRPK
jgi:hypothetical protein